MTHPSVPEISSAKDVDLLLRVANEHDEHAFEEILRRYQKRFYNLALGLLHDSGAAMDAVQEAMLRLWRSAHRFDPQAKGSPKSWLMSILVRECLKLRRKAGRHRNERVLAYGSLVGDNPDRSFEKQDGLDLLQEALRGLPEPDRELVALHFCSGLSQDRIGKLLAVPQTTISSRLRSIKNRLKASLEKAGLCCSEAFISAGLERILETGEPPTSLVTSLMERLHADPSDQGGGWPITEIKGVGQNLPGRTRGSFLSANRTVLLSASMLMLGAAVFALQTLKAPKKDPGLETAGKRLANDLSARVPARLGKDEQALPLPTYLDFKEGIPELLALARGKWMLLPSDEGEPATLAFPDPDLRSRSSELTTVLIDRPVPPESLLQVTFHLRALLPRQYGIVPRWTDGKGRSIPSRHWVFTATRGMEVHIECTYYMFDRWVFGFSGTQPISVTRYERVDAESRLSFVGHNCRLRDIQIEAIGKSELPSGLKDPDQYVLELVRDSSPSMSGRL